jgi:hypothetical protein
MKQTQKLSKYLEEIKSHIPKFEEKNLKVTKSTVGWQIDHSLKVINGIISALKDAPTDKKSKLTLLGRFCLTTKYIPRGKGKAPKQVLPPETIEESELNTQLATAKTLVPLLKDINPKTTFKHPYFGVLNTKQTIKFIEVHTKHHLKIIEDILKK